MAPSESRLARYFSDYASYHRTPGNKFFHSLGIPLIVMTLLGLLGSLPIAGGLTGSDYLRLDAGILTLALACLWYLALEWKLAIPFSLVALGLYFIGRATPVPALWAGFILGWIFQLIGHSHYEKNRPAFVKNFEHLLIGPLWVFARLSGYMPVDTASQRH